MSTSPDADHHAAYHHKDLRTALVDAGLTLLAQSGADALSLRAVARHAGVSAMAPYRHYPNKEALLAAVATRGFEGLRDALRLADDAAPPDEALTAQAVAYVRYALDNPALFRLMFGPRTDHPHPSLMVTGESAYAVLEARVAATTPPSQDRAARALGYWAMVHGLASLFLDGQLRDKIQASEAEITRRVTETMAAPLFAK